MKKKKNKRKKLYKFLVILILLGIGSLIYFYLPIKNIYIKGNTLLTDQEIIELAGIENYPRLFEFSSKKIASKIKMNNYIEDVKVKKNLFGRIDIQITEYNMLLKDELDSKIYLSNLEKITPDETIIGLPSLINGVDNDILKEFLKKLDQIDKTILGKISEIEYTPNEYDKDLFLFYMNDGNYIYITTKRLLNINKYEDVLKQLNGKKGILYLDSGNHFQILQ